LVWATTTKDWVKIPEQVRTNIVAITGQFKFDNEEMLEDLLKEALS
jgi:tetraacyldisaccharide-1-P 4'-kinase